MDGPSDLIARRKFGLRMIAAHERGAIRADKGVILTAGGFAMNKAMIHQYAPELKKALFN